MNASVNVYEPFPNNWYLHTLTGDLIGDEQTNDSYTSINFSGCISGRNS